MMLRLRSSLALLVLAAVSLTLGSGPEPYRPTLDELKDSYRRADTIAREYNSRVFNVRLAVGWYGAGKRLYYMSEPARDRREFVSVDVLSGKKTPLFDHARLAQALGGDAQAANLPIRNVEMADDGQSMKFDRGEEYWQCDLKTYTLTKLPPKPRGGRRNTAFEQDLSLPSRDQSTSPDKLWTVRIDAYNVKVKPKDGAEFALTDQGTAQAYFSRVYWRPDSKKLIAIRVMPGDRKPVYLVQSSPPDGGRAKLITRPYDLPGDKTDSFDLWILDLASRTAKPIQADPVDYWEMPTPRWRLDGRHFTYEKLDRGYQRWRVINVDTDTGSTQALIDDREKTFFDITSKSIDYCRQTDEMVWRSEMDGWGHLYLSDASGKASRQITKGDWVVRGVDKVDEKSRKIVFQASGMNPGEDPYFIHYYRIGFDGTGLTRLTPMPGNHSAQFSPDGSFMVDTCSTVDGAPVHELRRVSDGKLITRLETADISSLIGYGWRAPEVFVAKARDGKTDIWGLVYRPSRLDPHKSYPVLEDIYAGPQDSFVPKSFAAYRAYQSMAELGFIVVKIDGMGTRNRSKAFHDVCWKNIADAGFPDRILWIKALAAKYPYVDATRVGVYGTSAGGQNSTGAVLFHPEFYKAAVSSCGCHDNRMDKVWWNEQWMGYPVGPEYAEQSNITNASKLQGNLLLMVGELDTNVPPESTYRLVDALIRANKDFDFLVIPGSDHTSGGPYGEHKRRDFFVRHLLGVEPPSWNASAP